MGKGIVDLDPRGLGRAAHDRRLGGSSGLVWRRDGGVSAAASGENRGQDERKAQAQRPA
jgi:hypothetical protein